MPPPGVSGSLHDILQTTVPQTRRVAVRPHAVIVAWHGVLTLAFEAWPKPLTELKKRIGDEPEFRSSAAENNFGTRWPKLTLAALNDDAPPLALEQLRDLTALCRGFGDELLLRTSSLAPVPLTHASMVLFASRSLHHCMCRVDYSFSVGKEESKTAINKKQQQQQEEYDEESYEIVQTVVKETTERLEEYLPKVNAPGHRWGEHYNTTWTEATLVCFLTNNEDEETSSSTILLLEILVSFRKRVDALLPGAYAWMPQESLHLSLRSLENRSNLPRDDNSNGDGTAKR